MVNISHRLGELFEMQVADSINGSQWRLTESWSPISNQIKQCKVDTLLTIHKSRLLNLSKNDLV